MIVHLLFVITGGGCTGPQMSRTSRLTNGSTKRSANSSCQCCWGPPSGAAARVSLKVHNVGFDRFVEVSINTEDKPWLTVSSSNQLDQIDCGPAVTWVTIRGHDGCLGIEEPGTLLLSWEEEWVHQARWRQDESAPIGQHLDFFRDWLNGWTAHRFLPALVIPYVFQPIIGLRLW